MKIKRVSSIKSGIYKFIFFVLTFLLVISITQEFFFTISALKRLELRLIDERFVSRGPIDIRDSSDIIILEITQETFDYIPDEYKAWPWPRFIFSNVVENLVEAGVKAIGIDLVMSNPDRIDEKYDSLLFNTIRKYKNIVVAGKIDIEQETYYESRNERNWAFIQHQDENFQNIFYSADSSIGLVQVVSDYDGVFRRYRTFAKSDVLNKNIPTFAFAVINKIYQLPPNFVAEIEETYFEISGHRIPKYDVSTLLVNFYGPDRTFPREKLINVLDDKDFNTQEEIDLETPINVWDDPDYGILYSNKFKDKIVLIGSTMPEDKDIIPVAISKGKRKGDNNMYGVEFHANAIQNVLWNDFIVKQSSLSEIVFLFILMFLVFYGSSFLKGIKIRTHFLIEIANVIFVFVIIYCVYWLGFYLFIEYKYLITIVSPIIAVIFGYVTITTYHFITERSQNKLIKGMFSTYVSRELVNELLLDPDKLKLGGEKRELTILFSDIAGFTSFSEKMDPEELVNFINEYLTEMTNIVLSNQGTLDKYLGDAIMAFWGAPIVIKDHAFLACKTAVEMQKRLNELRQKRNVSPDKQINIRIGINSGEVVVGNIGGENRFDYTVMGDNVNLASRLEGANKQYGSDIMIGENSYEMVKDKILTRELDRIKVKGKQNPTQVYQLIGLRNDVDAEQKLLKLQSYLNGLNEYRKTNFNSAIKFFEESLVTNPGDGPSLVYLERSKFYLENPPGENWDGVFVMKTK